MPGRSDNPAAFWHSLGKAVDPICSVPSDRWDEQVYAESGDSSVSKCYIQVGGFVVDFEGFDSTFFRISASEAKQMDPQQRAILEV